MPNEVKSYIPGEPVIIAVHGFDFKGKRKTKMMSWEPGYGYKALTFFGSDKLAQVHVTYNPEI